MTTPLGGSEQFVGNQNGTTGITTAADISNYIGQFVMPIIYGGQVNKLPIQTSSGTLINSGIDINDSVALTQNLWTAYKTSTAISGALAPYILKVVGAVTGNIATFNSSGAVIDNGLNVNDTVTTTSNIWSASQTQAAITQGLLNVPSLPAVHIASTANVASKSGLPVIDGQTPTAGQWILLKNQTDNDNGVWKFVGVGQPWVRQKYTGTTFTDVTSETTYAQLGINGGITNVQTGNVNKNLQFQITINNPSAVFGATIVTVTSTTKLPALNVQNIYIDSTAGNDTNFNGTQSFPFATLAKGFAAIATTPMTMNLMGNSAYADNITWTQTNTTVQGNNLSSNGGTQTISGIQTFAANSRYNHFVNTYHSTGSNAPFAFVSGALCSNEFKNISVVSSAADWLGLNAGCRNWIRLNNITFGTPGINAINLPAFTSAFTIYIDQQDTFRGPIIFTGTGAANTTIYIAAGIAEGNVRIPTGFLGSVIWGQPFTAKLGSGGHPSGEFTTQLDMTTTLSFIASTVNDGYYAISGFNPTSFARGAIIGKQTVPGVATSIWLVRSFGQAPQVVSDIFQGMYTGNAGTFDWNQISFSTSSTVYPVDALTTRPLHLWSHRKRTSSCGPFVGTLASNRTYTSGTTHIPAYQMPAFSSTAAQITAAQTAYQAAITTAQNTRDAAIVALQVAADAAAGAWPMKVEDFAQRFTPAEFNAMRLSNDATIKAFVNNISNIAPNVVSGNYVYPTITKPATQAACQAAITAGLIRASCKPA
jgi:hypothetical protein